MKDRKFRCRELKKVFDVYDKGKKLNILKLTSKSEELFCIPLMRCGTRQDNEVVEEDLY